VGVPRTLIQGITRRPAGPLALRKTDKCKNSDESVISPSRESRKTQEKMQAGSALVSASGSWGGMSSPPG